MYPPAVGTNETRKVWWRRHLELIATIVISASAILTAWSSFQAAQWNTEASQNNLAMGGARTESTRFELLAGQERAIDVVVFSTWLEAFYTDLTEGRVEIAPGAYEPVPGTLSGFVHERMRPDFRPAFDAWFRAYSQDPATAPSTPFEMEEYRLPNAERADELLEQVQVHGELAQRASDYSKDYLLVALGFALAIFFGGISSKLEKELTRRITVTMGIAIFTACLFLLFVQPRVLPF